jgi:hypothetical protein
MGKIPLKERYPIASVGHVSKVNENRGNVSWASAVTVSSAQRELPTLSATTRQAPCRASHPALETKQSKRGSAR